MARGEVWNQIDTLFRVGVFKIVEARLFVAQDDAKPLPKAFRMLVSIRVLGVEVDGGTGSNNFAVEDGKVCVPIDVATFGGKLDGAITGWEGVKANGTGAGSASWADAEYVRYTLAALGKVTIPVAAIFAIVPGIGSILRALLSALPGQQVAFTLGTVAVDVPIHRTNGKVTLPPRAVVPAWWS
jgi:hypothetical protein